MSKKILLLIVCIMAMAVARAQSAETDGAPPESFSSHRVMMGETVVLLAKKYKMTPQDIYEYNPDATEGISQGMLLKIPMHRQVDLSTPQPKKEPVAYAETPAKGKRQGGASPERAEPKPSYNAADKPAETTQETAVQPVKSQTPPAETAAAQPATLSGTVTHTVQRGETLFGLAKKYGVSIDDIKQQNAGLKHGLQIGQTLTITAGAEAVAAKDPATDANAITPVTTEGGYTSHTVQNGETLFGLSKKYGVTVGQITDANKKVLKNGLQAGQTLKIPAAQPATAENIEH